MRKKNASSAKRRIINLSLSMDNKSPIFWLKCVRISLIKKRNKILEYWSPCFTQVCSSLFNILSICTYDMRKPIQFIQFMLTRLYSKHNISYNIVVDTNTVNKQANTYTRTHSRTDTHTHTRTHTHAHAHTRTHTNTHAHTTIYVSQLKLHNLKK